MARRFQVQRFGLNSGSALGSLGTKAGAIRPFLLRWVASRLPANQGSVSAPRRWRPWQLLPWLVLLAGVLASVFLFSALRAAVEDVARLRFERQAGDAKGVIEGRIHSYSDVLYGLKALFAMHGLVSRAQFHRFVQALDLKSRYPGFDVVNFAPYVTAREVERFVESVRRDTSLDPAGYPHFAINPAGARPEYFVVAYLEPMAGYETVFGRDLSAIPQVADPGAFGTALRSARDTGKLTASSVPIRITSANEYVGLAMRLPVYRLGMPVGTVEARRAAYIGSVGAGFNMAELMKGVLNDEILQQMRFSVYDTGSAEQREGSARRLLFDSNQLLESTARIADAHESDAFSRVLHIEVGGRVWQTVFHAPKRKAIDRVDKLLPWIVLIGGIMASSLLCGVLFSLASSRSRALKIAVDMTKHLRESEASLAQAQRMAHLGNWSLDPSNALMTWSSETYRILGFARDTAPKPFAQFLERIHPEDRAFVRDSLLGAIEVQQPREIEHRVLLPDGTLRWVHTIMQGNAEPPVPGTLMDITERKRAEQELLESRALLNDAQKLASVGCCQYSPADGRVIWSEALYRIHGVDPRTFTPTFESTIGLIHPADRAAWQETLAAALRNRKPFAAEFRIVRPDGTVRHLRSLGEVIGDAAGKPSRMLWSVLDISAQKDTEHALRNSAEQLTALSRRLVEVQEAERRKLSRELHDRVGQNLTALSINLDILRTTLPGERYADQRARLNDSSDLLESTADSIENVMAELRPPMLDDYGLLPALHWYARDFSKRTGVEVAVTGHEHADRLAPEIEITLFRIAQEALTNVAKHARASRVEIALDQADQRCLMTITDDGIGIDTTPSASTRPRLGMVTMRERSQAIGGRFEVRTMAGGGTRIGISIP
jgi:PAS domain S-box-containing protein